MKFICNVIVSVLVLSSAAFAQLNTEGAFGGTGDDSIAYVSPTIAEDGYVVYGISNSFSSSSEIFLMRTDQSGNYSWAKNISNTNWDFQPIAACEANNSTETDENYVVVLHRNNEDYIHILNYNRNSDSFTDRNYVNIQINEMGSYDLVRTANGYILIVYQVGGTRTNIVSFDNDFQFRANLSEQHSSSVTTDVFVNDAGNIFLAGTAEDNRYMFIKQVDENLNSTGIGEKFYGVPFDQGGEARVTNVQLTQGKNGDFVIGASAVSNPTNGKVIIKTDSNGENSVAYEYGIENTADFYITDVATVSDGYVFTGYTDKSYSASAGEEDILFVRLAQDMTLEKAAIFGDEEVDRGKFIYPNPDNSVTMFALTNSFSVGGDYDFYVIKTGSSGNTLCNERTVGFALEEETCNEMPSQTIYSGNPSVNPQSDPGLTYDTKDIKLTSLCACEQELTFETSGSACVGETVMFSDLGGNLNFTWDFGSGVVDSSYSDGTIYITYDSPGIRMVTVDVDNSSCFKSGQKAVTIYPVPDISITAPSAVCTNAEYSFSADVTPVDAGPWQYDWDFGNNVKPQSSTSQQVEHVVFEGNSRTVPVSLSVSDAHCSNSEVVNVEVEKSPDADFSVISPNCEGAELTFHNHGTTADSYEWDFGSSQSGNTTTGQNPTFTYNNPGTYTVELAVSEGLCTDTSRHTVVVHPIPDITITGNNAVCTGVKEAYSASVEPADASNWNYAWDFGDDVVPQIHTTSSIDSVVFAGVSRTAQVSLTVSDALCSNTVEYPVAVTQSPEVGFSVTEPYCDGSEVQFNNQGTESADGYAWDFGTNQSVNSSVDEQPVFVFEEAGEYLVTQTISVGACSNTFEDYVTIHPTPNISFTSNADEQNCAGDFVSFSSTVSPMLSGKNWSYNWDFGHDAQPKTSQVQMPSEVAYSSGGDKKVTFEVSSEYCSSSITQTIEIDKLPVPSVIQDDTVCADRCLSIGGQTIPDALYSWYPSTTLDNPNTANPTACPVADHTSYVVTVTDVNGCVGTDTVSVTMLKPAVANAGVDVEICYGDSVQIGAGYIEGQNYSWLPATHISDTKIANPFVSPTESTVYSLATNYKGCDFVYDEVTVTVHQLPDVRAYIHDHKKEITIAKGESVQLYGSGALQFEWSPWNGLNNEGIYNPVASPEESVDYVLRGVDMHGCENSDTVSIEVITPDFWVPNSFTPNNDGRNDEFYVYAQETVDFSLTIFSRSGQKVFSSQDKDFGWDGTLLSTGEKLPQGAYVYYVKGTYTDGNTFEDKGIVNLVR
ncbi:MAG: PKD domain-containing protein [Bacteroidales bacterium]